MNTYGSIGNQTAGWYARKLLSHARPVLVLEAFALAKQLPQNQTKVIEFRRSRQLPKAAELAEGRAPTPQTFGYDAVSIQMRQYGAVVKITDQIQDFSKDRVLPDIVERQGEQIGEIREELLWDVVRAGTNVVYAGRRTARSALTKDDVYNVAMQRRMVSVLKSNKAQPITSVLKPSAKYETYSVDAAYIAVCHTHLIPTLSELSGTSSASTNHFTPISKHGSMRPVSIHEEGAFEKVRYVTSPDLEQYSGAGSSTALTGDDRYDYYNNGGTTFRLDVFTTVLFGREAFGTVALRGKRAVQPIIVKPGTPDSGKLLGQIGWAGWKMYFAGRILNETWMVRGEHAVKVA